MYKSILALLISFLSIFTFTGSLVLGNYSLFITSVIVFVISLFFLNRELA